MGFSEAVTTVVESIALPYGYTLAVWSSGMLAVRTYGVKHFWEIFLFVLGAVLGFLVFEIPVMTAVEDDYAVRIPSVTLFNVLPLGAVVVTSLFTRQIRRRHLGYFVSGASATVVYVLSLAVLMTLFA
jgi:hypothetical protein